MKRFAAILAALALCGCITVPEGTKEAFDANSAILDIVAKDEESATAEMAPWFATLKDAERARVFGEWFDATLEGAAETSDTLALRSDFVGYGFKAEKTLNDFDTPLDRWHARGVERAKWIRQAMKNSGDTLDALKSAQLTPGGTPNVEPQ